MVTAAAFSTALLIVNNDNYEAGFAKTKRWKESQDEERNKNEKEQSKENENDFCFLLQTLISIYEALCASITLSIGYYFVICLKLFLHSFLFDI